MNQKTIIGIIVAVVAVGGISAYLVFGRSSGGGEQQNVMAPSSSNTGAMMQGATLKDLVAATTPERCSFGDTSAGNASGTMYIGNGNVRGDFSAVNDGKTMMGHMIVTGQQSFTWFDGTDTGFKSSLQSPVANTAPQQRGFDANQKQNYQCTPWTVDTSYFDVPTNVQFVDASNMGAAGRMMKTNQLFDGQTAPPSTVNSKSGVSGSVQTSQCAACSSLSEPQRTQCRTALGCN